MSYLKGFSVRLEKDNHGDRSIRCTYHRNKERERWVSSCGLTLGYLGRDFIYCPRCGKQIMKEI